MKKILLLIAIIISSFTAIYSGHCNPSHTDGYNVCVNKQSGGLTKKECCESKYHGDGTWVS